MLFKQSSLFALRWSALGRTSRNTRQMKRNCTSDWCLIAWAHNSIGSPEILNKNLFRYRGFHYFWLSFRVLDVAALWAQLWVRLCVVSLNLQVLASGLQTGVQQWCNCMSLKQGKKWIITLGSALQTLWSTSFFTGGGEGRQNGNSLSYLAFASQNNFFRAMEYYASVSWVAIQRSR